MQNTITQNSSFGYNIGAEWNGVDNSPEIIYTLVTDWSITDDLDTYIEAFGSFKKAQTPEHSMDGGFAYNLNNNCKVDISTGVGISKAAPDWYSSIGCSIRFHSKGK